jgi:hypothetical protein
LTEGNLELVEIVAAWIAALPATIAVIVRDERRLSGSELARAWPSQSRDSAIYVLWNLGLPHLSVLVHFARTRRNLRGIAIGTLWFAAICACIFGAEATVDTLVEWLHL